MPVAWLGLALIVALAVPGWWLARRARASGGERARNRQRASLGLPDAGRDGGLAASTENGSSRSPAMGRDAVLPSSPDALSAVEIFRRLHELAFRVERLGLPALDAYDAIAPSVLATLESAAAHPRYAPRRPLLLPQLLRAMRDDEVSRAELARIIAQDPALAGSLLRLANGAFFRVSEKPVESIDRAVALLGTDGIRSLVATALVQPVFRLSERQFPSFPETLWDHTIRAAAAAESHAAIVEDSDPFAAQLLGLTMGLGAIVVFRVALDRYAARAEEQRDMSSPNAAVIASLLDSQTAAVACRIASSWNLSDRILAALEDQKPARDVHDPSSLGRSLQFGRLMGAMAVLRTADRLTDEIAKASMLSIGATEFQFDRIWARLTGSRDAERGARRDRA